MSVSPNPTRGLVTVRLADDRPATFTLHDAAGRAVMHLPGDNGGDLHTIDISGLSSGLYHLHVLQNDEVKRVKLVKE